MPFKILLLLSMLGTNILPSKQYDAPPVKPVVNLFLDSIPAGNITRNQLMNVKHLRAKSGADELRVTSFEIAVMTLKGDGKYLKVSGDEIKDSSFFGGAVNGNKVVLTDLKISG